MTIKEMLKKVEIYNEVAEQLGNQKAELRFVEGYGLSDPVGSFATFRKYIKETYIKTVAEDILKYDGYEFGTEAEFVDEWELCGIKHHDVIKVTFFIH